MLLHVGERVLRERFFIANGVFLRFDVNPRGMAPLRCAILLKVCFV